MIDKLLRKTNAFKGKQRLARLLLKAKIKTGRDIIVKGLYDCVYKLPNIKENIGFEVFINGIYEKETIDFIINRIPPGGVLIDIGANIGAICVPVCKRRSDINVIAVEGSPRVFSYLEHNIGQNELSNCKIENKAIADKDAEKVNFFSPEDLFGKGSMSAVFTKQAEEVETITLDTLVTEKGVKRVDLIKIDVEGFEYFAFKGGRELLGKQDAPDILFEFVDWAEDLAKGTRPGDAQQLLLQYGYSLWQINSSGKLIFMDTPVLKGSVMIWASKKK